MSPTVLIAVGLMIRDVKGGQEADRFVFIITYTANSFPAGYNAALLFQL